MAIISQKQLEDAERALVALGIEHYMILMPPDDDGKMSTLFHQMKAADTLNLLINTIISAIDHELAANPSYTKEYQKIFLDFKAAFKSAVDTVNSKVEKYEAKHTKNDH